ncbi:MAG: hypothetical protein HKN44_05735 [Ilumatobacter sp.]|nr:hypothetical protein [Ilumatobacter sp.]
MTSRRRKLSSLAIVVAFLMGLGTLTWTWTNVRTTSANFGDRETLDRNHLGAGTLDVAVGANTVSFDVIDMAAGDLQDGRLEVTNSGSLPLRYAVSAGSSGGPLAAVIELALWLDDGSTCASQPPATAWFHPTGQTVVALSGTPRALAPGQSEMLCMLGRLPLSAPSSAQGRELALNIVITAEHDLEVSS